MIVTWTQQSHFARLFGRLCEHTLLRKIQYKCRNSLVLCVRLGTVPLRVVVAKILEDAVKLGFGPIRVCTTAGQSVTPLDPKLLPEQPCDPGVRDLICCSCHAARASIFPLSLHDFPDLSHAGASGLERKSDTFSVLLHTLLNGLSS